MMISISMQQLSLVTLLCLPGLAAFVSPHQKSRVQIPLYLEESNDNGNSDEAGPEDEDELPIMQSTMYVDDGGSDLTDRFKYKVNALMGVFDPQTGTDDETQAGNILNAMLNFPTQFTFNVVGKTKGEDKLKQDYIDQVKKTVTSLSGDEDQFQCKITPRGKSFTRVSIQVRVDSAAVINSIYDELGKMEMTVMNY